MTLSTMTKHQSYWSQ